METQLIALKDPSNPKAPVEWLDRSDGWVYAAQDGSKRLRQMEETEFLCTGNDRGQPTPVRNGDGHMVHVSEIATEANRHYYQQTADLLGRKLRMGSRELGGKKVLMDLGVGDVHTPATQSNYIGGYHLADGVADAASPVILTAKQSNVYYNWNALSDFNRKLGAASAPGGAVNEVNPSTQNNTYNTVSYALAAFMPTEIQSNADTPIRPFNKAVQVVVDALRLEREWRVANQLQTSGNWNANLVTTIAAGAQWDGGGASDPIANIHRVMEQSYMEDGLIMIWSSQVEHDFLRNPQVQKYFTYKDMVDGLPDPTKLSSILKLPPIFTARMKYTTNSGQLQYVWGNHVVFVRIPKEMPPTSQMEISTAATFRWLGGDAPDGGASPQSGGLLAGGGVLVRTFFDPKRGPRGGTSVVCTHNDAEVMTSGLVGGLLLNAHQ